MKTLALPLAACVAALSCGHASAAVFPIANGNIAALKAAITAANTNGADDTIELAANGTYTLTVVDNGDGGAGSGNGLPQIASDGGKSLTTRAGTDAGRGIDYKKFGELGRLAAHSLRRVSKHP